MTTIATMDSTTTPVAIAMVAREMPDPIGTEFGGRHELYEINYAGSQDEIGSLAESFARMRTSVTQAMKMLDN